MTVMNLPPPSIGVRWFVILFPLIVVAFLTVMFIGQFGDKPMSLIGLLLISAFIVALDAVIFIPVYRRRAIELDEHGCTIKAAWYSHHLSWQTIDWSNSGIMTEAQQRDKAPKWRTNGIGVPGYGAGWFSLIDKRSAFLALTDKAAPRLLLATPQLDIIVSTLNPHHDWQQIQSAAQRG